MKIAITGKGGSGKTTLAGLLARAFAQDGKKVLAIDADPDANLASAIGFSAESVAKLQPFSKMKDLAKERTGAGYGGLFILNPKVDDLPEAFSVEHQGVQLLMMGTVEQGGTGCVCPEHTLLRSLVKHLLLKRDTVLIMDMEAGIEHLGRSTADAVDVLIVVVEPGHRSIQTSRQIEKLAADIGIKTIAYVGSKIKDASDIDFIKANISDKTLLGTISYCESVREADKHNKSPFDMGHDVMDELAEIKTKLLGLESKVIE